MRLYKLITSMVIIETQEQGYAAQNENPCTDRETMPIVKCRVERWGAPSSMTRPHAAHVGACLAPYHHIRDLLWGRDVLSTAQPFTLDVLQYRSTFIRSTAMDRKRADELQEHMLGTYFGLRVGLVAIGVALPLVVLFTGELLHEVGLKSSISDYYHPGPKARPFFTTRDFFVGGLFAAAACLYLYKGFSAKENIALNMAAVFACFVALLPTGLGEDDKGVVPLLHGTSAVLFFLCIAYVSLFHSRDTLRLLTSARRAKFAQRYVWTGLALVVSPLVAVGFSYTLEGRLRAFIFWLEAFAVWAFAYYWFTKTQEMRESRAERRALDAELEREVVPVTPPAEAAATGPGGMSGAILRKLSPASGKVERIVPAGSSSAPAVPPSPSLAPPDAPPNARS